MGEVISAKDQTLSKAEAEKAGVVVTGDNLALSSDSLAVSSNPEPTVKRETREGEWFVSDRALHLTADGKVVEEDDPDGKTVLVGKGGRLSMAEAEKYGLAGKKASNASKAKTAEAKGEEKKGRLPDDFPHYAALEAAGITSYGKLRDLKGDYSSIDGIGEARAKEIDEALA